MRRGFSLVELMIVVAIIGILAAIAVPRYQEMQYRAKRSELPSVVDGIRTSMLGYGVAHDAFLDCPMNPRPRLDMDKQAVAWTNPTGTNWLNLGWSPDGDVRGSYETRVEGGGKDFRVFGATDVDDDNNEAHYYATRDNTPWLDSPNNVY